MLMQTNNILAATLIVVCAVFPKLAAADIVYPSGYVASIGNPGTYVQRWSTAGGTTPGVVSCSTTNGTCIVGPSYQWRDAVNGQYLWRFHTVIQNTIVVPQGTTWNEAVRQWIARFGRSGTVTSTWYIRVGTLIKTCMRAAGEYEFSTGQIPLPATCDAIAPAPAKCNFSAQAITLNHQTIDKPSVDGHIATANLSVNCSSAANVIVANVQGNGPITVLPGITSTLQIDKRALGTQMQWPAGISNHALTSTLRDTGTAYGQFNTSVVLRITIL